jgi:uncharacterized protein
MDDAVNMDDAPAAPVAAAPRPVQETERIGSLDVLRGVAVLGILTMNIQSFAMPGAAYSNPTAWGSLEGLNGWVWTLSHLFGDLKFMATFSILFGAGMVLMADRQVERGGSAWRLHLKRMFWLLIFGLVHAHLIWYGDILVGYAVMGTLVFGLRNRRPRTLIAGALVFWLVGSGIIAAAGLSLPDWPEADRAAFALDLDPPAEVKAAEVAAYRGGFAEQFAQRSPVALGFETEALIFFLAWRVGGLMLLGMALYKLGVLSAARPRGFYLRLLATGWLLGLPIVGLGILWNRSIDWAAPDFFFLGSLPNYWGSLGVALGWIAGVMLLCRSSGWSGVKSRLSAVGRMAFTNYIAQSLICTWIFYGHGLGLFGQVDRVGQFGIVLLVWALQLWWSPLWLARFRYGPLEWLWRSLVYRRRQPFRRHAAGRAPA